MEASRYLGLKQVGELFNVSAATVSKWRTRYAETEHPTPAPVVWIGDTPGWSDASSWKAWKLALPGRGTGGGPLPLGQAREEYRKALAAAREEHPNDTTEWHHEVRALRQIASTYNVDADGLNALSVDIMQANPGKSNEECNVIAVATVVRSARGKQLAS